MTALAVVLAIALAGACAAVIALSRAWADARGDRAAAQGEAATLRAQLERAAIDLHTAADAHVAEVHTTAVLEDRAHAEIATRLARPDGAARDRIVLRIRERAEAARAAARGGAGPAAGPVPAPAAATSTGGASDGDDL